MHCVAYIMVTHAQQQCWIPNVEILNVETPNVGIPNGNADS